MYVEIGAEAALFPKKEYINGIAVAVWSGEFSSPDLDESQKSCKCLFELQNRPNFLARVKRTRNITS
jgi:hypothetical protein